MKFIKDEDFIRGNCPMTKEEARILSIAKLNVNENSNVLDIGAGTGSISIQLAKICSNGKIVSIEKNKEAVDIINSNIEKFKINNIDLIDKDIIDTLPIINEKFDGIFIGGSDGNIKEIIQESKELLNPNGTMVLNFITLSNLYSAIETLKEYKYEINITQVAISKSKGQNYMMVANNPIFIVCAKK
ncbi:MAG: precorrin-6Y C5,15-methyltransferase (decarboxylating) subunit CbiT [Methanobrevibacter sp.]|jgi:precorrin-6Y C5,15-methyltransferase (decarboxylating) CbiT subunit|nr:precorrin-6Y C5,15-methyltransferase (decarboxylating) subunit CbiT [Candidatus Methanovirga meridionalis]